MSKEINNDDSSKGNEYTSESLMEVLQVIEDPELKMSIVDLGLIYKIVVSDEYYR